MLKKTKHIFYLFVIIFCLNTNLQSMETQNPNANLLASTQNSKELEEIDLTNLRHVLNVESEENMTKSLKHQNPTEYKKKLVNEIEIALKEKKSAKAFMLTQELVMLNIHQVHEATQHQELLNEARSKKEAHRAQMWNLCQAGTTLFLISLVVTITEIVKNYL